MSDKSSWQRERLWMTSNKGSLHSGSRDRHVVCGPCDDKSSDRATIGL